VLAAGRVARRIVGERRSGRAELTGDVALQLQGSPEVSLSRHGLMASPPDRPRDDECRLDPTLG